MKKIEGFIVDDNSDFSDIIQHYLGLHGLVAQHAVSLSEGQRLLAISNNVDFVVCDFRLPDGNSIGLVHSIRQKFPLAIIVVVSGYCSDEDANTCRAGGAIFMAKPFDLAVLKDILLGNCRSSGA